MCLLKCVIHRLTTKKTGFVKKSVFFLNFSR